MRGRARSRVAWCIAALLAAAGAAAPSLAGGKGDMIDKSTIMLEGILKSVEAGDVLEPGPLVYLQAESDRDNPMAMYILGWYRLKRNQWDTGLSLLEKSADKNYIRAQLVLAQTALSHKDFPGATRWIDRARANRDSAAFPHHIARLEDAVRAESEATGKALATSRLVDLSKKAVNELTPPQADKPAAGDCRDDLASVKDPDIARNAERIRKAKLCYREEKLSDKGLDWTLAIIENRAQPQGPRIAIPRDNEGSAFDTAVYAVASYGGRMVAVQTGESKRSRVQDPNRAFGSGKSCSGLKRPAPRYTERMVGLLKGGRHWFSFHDNEGGLSASTTAGQMTGYVNPEAAGALADPQNVVVIAGSDPPTEPGPTGWRNRLQTLGMNVIYEEVDKATNDCSMSNYLVIHRLAGVGKYFNIMVGKNDEQTQKKMADLLFGNLGYRKLSVTASKAKP